MFSTRKADNFTFKNIHTHHTMDKDDIQNRQKINSYNTDRSEKEMLVIIPDFRYRRCDKTSDSHGYVDMTGA